MATEFFCTLRVHSLYNCSKIGVPHKLDYRAFRCKLCCVFEEVFQKWQIYFWKNRNTGTIHAPAGTGPVRPGRPMIRQYALIEAKLRRSQPYPERRVPQTCSFFSSSLLKFLLKSIEDKVGFHRMSTDNRKGQNPYFSMDFGLSWSLANHQLVEAGATNQKRQAIEILDSNTYRLSLRCH